ncbi:unnamed protein product [Schistosoma curassoni]|uniref:Reverse transcriptase domain-containing protein n=1 Tax=Schistosoma curassoni TaxID=6186 RepID=A0A183K3W5_9TREM|nr:unnamed protein product [Schistosoma curassoni]
MSTSVGKHVIQCTAGIQLDNLEFTEDLALLSYTQQQMLENTISVAAASATLGLNINKRKGKILRYDTTCTKRITLDGEHLENVKLFTYLGSMIDEHGESDADVNLWIGKSTAAYLRLKNI